jgi:hypothetical protein
MKMLKRFVASTAFVAMMFSSTHAKAECYETSGGSGYEECCRAPCLAPAVALGTIALIAIIAIAVQNSHNGHGHSH